tara:strand:+ start:541 stop:786 length:246 start_codon:yes stop_codon:yes gene_type:complete
MAEFAIVTIISLADTVALAFNVKVLFVAIAVAKVFNGERFEPLTLYKAVVLPIGNGLLFIKFLKVKVDPVDELAIVPIENT